jgi:dienelactone hydrolase
LLHIGRSRADQSKSRSRRSNRFSITMLIKESHVDVSTSTTPMRLFLFHPVLSSGVKARFPAVAVFTEIYQVTAPVSRFCRQIAGRGFIVASCSSYHEFMGPEALAYDDQGIPVGWLIQGQRLGMITRWRRLWRDMMMMQR